MLQTHTAGSLTTWVLGNLPGNKHPSFACPLILNRRQDSSMSQEERQHTHALKSPLKSPVLHSPRVQLKNHHRVSPELRLHHKPLVATGETQNGHRRAMRSKRQAPAHFHPWLRRTAAEGANLGQTFTCLRYHSESC